MSKDEEECGGSCCWVVSESGIDSASKLTVFPSWKDLSFFLSLARNRSNELLSIYQFRELEKKETDLSPPEEGIISKSISTARNGGIDNNEFQEVFLSNRSQRNGYTTMCR